MVGADDLPRVGRRGTSPRTRDVPQQSRARTYRVVEARVRFGRPPTHLRTDLTYFAHQHQVSWSYHDETSTERLHRRQSDLPSETARRPWDLEPGNGGPRSL